MKEDSMKDPARWAVLAALLVGRAPAAAQTALPLKHAPQSTTAAITPADLMTRLYIYADDSMMGRRGGTEWNLKATAYIASEVKRMGLVPMGDSGTYFQWVPLVNLEFDTASTAPTAIVLGVSNSRSNGWALSRWAIAARTSNGCPS